MPGTGQHRTPYWYRHSYHQPNSLQFFPPTHFVHPVHPVQSCQAVHVAGHDNEPKFMRQRSRRQLPRTSSIHDLQYSPDSSPTSSVPSVHAKCSSSGSNTDSGVGRTDSQSSSELTNLDQSGSSLPSVNGSSGINNSSPEHEFTNSQIPVWKRNGRFVNFFRSFISSRPGGKDKEKSKVFGAELSQHLTDTTDEVPQVLRTCSLFLEDHGIIDGIYRVSGITSNIQRIKNKFDSFQVPNLTTDPAVLHDIHCVASVLKLYFRDLPTPLVTYDLYPHLVLASKTSEHVRVEKYKEILLRLPQSHYRTMDWLMRHLYRMSLHGEKTGMTAKNLAIVWAPNLLRCDTSELDTADALQDVGLQAVITEFLIRCAMTIFSLTIPKSVPAFSPQNTDRLCVHCCCHCNSSSTTQQQDSTVEPPPPSVTFAPQTSHPHNGHLKSAIKNSEVITRRSGPLRPRPRSVAVANPSSTTSFTLEEVKMLALPDKQSAQLVDVETGQVTMSGLSGPTSLPIHGDQQQLADGSISTNVPMSSVPLPTCQNGQCSLSTQPKVVSDFRPSVTFHTVLEGPQKKEGQKSKKVWKNIFNVQQFNKNSGSSRSLRKIDSDFFPENKPLKMRPRPKSELNLAYSVQDSTLMLTPMKNNEFQVRTTNQFSYLPYQQHLHNCNNNNNVKMQQLQQLQQPFARTNKLRQNVNIRQNCQRSQTAQRPKSVDFEVLKSLENICRSQPLAYSSGPGPCTLGNKMMTSETLGGDRDRRVCGHVRASQRDRHKEVMVGEWQQMHATRV